MATRLSASLVSSGLRQLPPLEELADRAFVEPRALARHDAGDHHLARALVRRAHRAADLDAGEGLQHLVAQRLGYAEQSVLTRSCVRWFSASPSRLRSHPHCAARPQLHRRLSARDGGPAEWGINISVGRISHS
jgi:AraC-like DNA-binding protein